MRATPKALFRLLHPRNPIAVVGLGCTYFGTLPYSLPLTGEQTMIALVHLVYD